MQGNQPVAGTIGLWEKVSILEIPFSYAGKSTYYRYHCIMKRSQYVEGTIQLCRKSACEGILGLWEKVSILEIPLNYVEKSVCWR
ncbi:hypothetical protein CEXT_427021 [Caerostris extrusa]|uniref:Uncharacterized protein n=1 Tax=Caerostris extrusa TaxID=172846 RepID=A0AAV4P2L7_CAEEX|nr:hypothetical protein CEXT_427021 [Caerostris extrusa]